MCYNGNFINIFVRLILKSIECLPSWPKHVWNRLLKFCTPTWNCNWWSFKLPTTPDWYGDCWVIPLIKQTHRQVQRAMGPKDVFITWNKNSKIKYNYGVQFFVYCYCMQQVSNKCWLRKSCCVLFTLNLECL